nr:unnamed protein product [Callosobruchus analis]
MSRHKRKGSTTDISNKMSQIEDRLETGEIRNQLGTAIATGAAQKNPDLLKYLTEKLNELENSIKSSLEEVKKEMREFLDTQKKRINENGVAFFGIQEGDTRVLPETIAKFITSKFDVEVTVADINYCYRMGAISTSSRANRSKRPRPVAVFFVNRWLRDRVFYAKSVLKGSGVVLCELLSNSDFNTDLLNFASSDAKNVIDIFESFGMKQLIKHPTRITANTATLIDYIVSSNEDIVSDAGTIHVAGVSDHESVYCLIDFRLKSNVTFVTTRNFKALNYDQFKSDLRSIPWKNIYDLIDVDSKVDFIVNNITTLLDLHVPMKTYRITKQYAPWLNTSVKGLMLLRDQALQAYKVTPHVAHWETYKALRNQVTAAVKREKRAYFKTKLSNCQNSKATWSVMRELGMSKAKSTNLPVNLSNADEINKYFINSVPVLDPVNFYKTNSFCQHDNSFKFKLVTEYEVLKFINSLKSKATGTDGINILTIQLCTPHILPYITHLMNFCLANSVYPEMWRKGLVIPLPKTKNPSSFENLRPITILPTLSKILEKIIESQLKKHLVKNNIIPVNQSGFKKNHSCTSALLKVTDDIFRANDQGKLTLLVLLDFSKAFDTLNHKLMLNILNYIGLSHSAVQLFDSYNSDRMQSVNVAGNRSSFLRLHSGVPQGSILGPLLFSVYTCQLKSALVSCQQHFYADDTQVYVSFFPDEAPQAICALNLDLHLLYNSSLQHCLKLNPLKSSLIVFGNRHTRSRFSEVNLPITINNEIIERKTTLKNLGLILDDNLRFSDHIKHKLQSAYLCLKTIYQNRQYLSMSMKKILCDSLVLSHLNYGDVIYDSCLTVSDAFRIQKLQNSCLRLIFGIRKYDHITHKLNDAHWLNMKNRRLLHACCMYLSLIRLKEPQYLIDKLEFRTDAHNVNLRHKNLLTTPSHNTEQFKRSFSYNIVRVYNNLPEAMRNLPSKSLIKIKLTQMLMSQQRNREIKNQR